jgi:nucleolar protein 14
MIMKSKQIKYEKQKERDKTLDLTEELDKEWKKILPLMGKLSNKNEKESENNEKKPDDFDVLVRSLQFDSKAQVNR